MGRRGRARQQPDENCRLAKETIVSQTSQTKSRVTLSFRSHPLKPACLSQAQSSTRSPESATTMVCACPSQTNPGPGKSLKSLLPTQIFLQNRGFAPETSLGVEVLYGGENAHFSSLKTLGAKDMILNLEKGHVTTA